MWLLVPNELAFNSVLAKQCGVVPGMVDRWHHHLIFLAVLGFTQIEASLPLVR